MRPLVGRGLELAGASLGVKSAIVVFFQGGRSILLFRHLHAPDVDEMASTVPSRNTDQGV